MNGLGVPVDRGKALNWFKRAAEHGDAYSKAQLTGTASGGDATAGKTSATSRPPPAFTFPPIRP